MGDYGLPTRPDRCRLAAVPPATKTPSKPSVAAPERSLVQRMEALERANKIRTRRAQLKRDLKAGRASIHDLLLEPPEFVETAKVFDMLLAVPKYGRVKVNKVLVQLPDLAEQDDRRPLAAAAHRARLDAPPLARPTPRVRSRVPVFVITGPSGVGKGTLIRALQRARARARARRSPPPPAQPRPGETDGVDYHFLTDDEFEARVNRGDFVEHARYSGRRYGTLRDELEQRGAGGTPGAARDRGPGRAPGPPGDARGDPGLHRAAERGRAARPGSSAAAPTRPRTSRAGSRPRARSSPRSTSSATSSSTTGSRTRWRSSRLWSAGAARLNRSPTEDLTLISPRVDKLLENVDSPYASVIVAAKRARQINSLLPQPRRGHVRGVPAAR